MRQFTRILQVLPLHIVGIQEYEFRNHNITFQLLRVRSKMLRMIRMQYTLHRNKTSKQKKEN